MSAPPKSEWPYQPADNQIPFFASRKEFAQHPQPRPRSLEPGARWPWLVQPGIHAVEVYEAIISTYFGRRQTPLEVWICQAGMQQLAPRACLPETPEEPPVRINHTLAADRDVCFVMLTYNESMAVKTWAPVYNYFFLFTPNITPFGILGTLCPMTNISPEKALKEALTELDLLDREFPRSALPTGVLPIAVVTGQVTRWRCPDDSDSSSSGHGRAVNDTHGRRRVAWVTPLPNNPTRIADDRNGSEPDDEVEERSDLPPPSRRDRAEPDMYWHIALRTLDIRKQRKLRASATCQS